MTETILTVFFLRWCGLATHQYVDVRYAWHHIVLFCTSLILLSIFNSAPIFHYGVWSVISGRNFIPFKRDD